MVTRAKACELFGNAYSEFEVDDPFNKGVSFRGYISRRPNELYGALFITHVNGIEQPQLIYATPKMRYPFDRAGRYCFPDARVIECYGKLDGTNVLAFEYRLGDLVFLSYKTRLLPTVRNGKFGPFYDMWLEMLQKYPQIEKLNRVNGCNISYELWGARNKHLVVYDVPLDVALLFGVTEIGQIVPPRKLDSLGVPTACLDAVVDKQYVESYEWYQLKMNEGLVEVEDGYRGEEGQVWYLADVSGRWIQFKCKPEIIEKIHFAGGLSKNTILATVWNVLENYDEITYERVEQLLLEEFQQHDIDRSKSVIEACIRTVQEESAFRAMVFADYDELKAQGMDILLDKGQVMRALSLRYEKKQMTKVYSLLVGGGR